MQRVRDADHAIGFGPVSNTGIPLGERVCSIARIHPSCTPKNPKTESDMSHHPTWTRRRALQSTAAAAAGSLAWMPSWAQDAKEIRIGQSCHLSGPLAPTLALPLKGQALAFERSEE